MRLLRPTQLGRFAPVPRYTVALRQPLLGARNAFVRRATSAPKNHEVLLSRRGDRELPRVTSPWLPWIKTFPIFIAIVTVSALGIFNYQKTSSSVVSSTLYALRTSDVGRAELGDKIYFRDSWPWIWGELNQVQGRIDVEFAVKGTKASGMMRFKCRRPERMGFVCSLTNADKN